MTAAAAAALLQRPASCCRLRSRSTPHVPFRNLTIQFILLATLQAGRRPTALPPLLQRRHWARGSVAGRPPGGVRLPVVYLFFLVASDWLQLLCNELLHQVDWPPSWPCKNWRTRQTPANTCRAACLLATLDLTFSQSYKQQQIQEADGPTLLCTGQRRACHVGGAAADWVMVGHRRPCRHQAQPCGSPSMSRSRRMRCRRPQSCWRCSGGRDGRPGGGGLPWKPYQRPIQIIRIARPPHVPPSPLGFPRCPNLFAFPPCRLAGNSRTMSP